MLNNVPKADKHQQYLDEHERLADLFVRDRFAFEQERKRILNETIDNYYSCEKWKEQLRTQQKELDSILKSVGSAENRFAMAQALLWHHLVNNWQPGLKERATTLNNLVRSKHIRPRLSLVK